MYTSDVLPLGLLLDCWGLRLLVLVHNLKQVALTTAHNRVMTPRDNLARIRCCCSASSLPSFVLRIGAGFTTFRLTYISSNTPSHTTRIS